MLVGYALFLAIPAGELASKTIFVCPLSPQLARIYNVCSRGVRRAILLNRTPRTFFGSQPLVTNDHV
jgi:hypothetical protein